MAPGRRGALVAGTLTAGLLVAACASNPPAQTSVSHSPNDGQQVLQRLAQYNTMVNSDLCQAGELQWLVGRQRSEIPVPVDVSNRRVACTTCPVTEDHSPYRLNIFYDRATGRIESVRCG